MGGLEYWPESSPCPSLALADEQKKGVNIMTYSQSPKSCWDFLSLLRHAEGLMHVCLHSSENKHLKSFRQDTWGLFAKSS